MKNKCEFVIRVKVLRVINFKRLIDHSHKEQIEIEHLETSIDPLINLNLFLILRILCLLKVSMNIMSVR